MKHASIRVLMLGALLVAAAPLVAQKPVARAEPGASAVAAPVSKAKSDSIARQEQLAYRREVFAYDAAGRRDPFVSLAATGVLRPTIADLSLVGIAYAARNGGSGAQSIAIFRDRTTKEQYRVRVGQPLGRMRVASIEPRRVVFSIDEFGISRQESIAMGDSTRTITPTRAP
ncbi:MAG: hypothetical protein V4813_19010 [Gemmatimonadota bacterium]